MNAQIHTLDLNFQTVPHAIASYLVIGPEGPVLVETGPASTLSQLKAALAAHQLTLADIRHVLVTHIHLDHAGAAGWIAAEGATVYVHHVGARHLIDPNKLLSSASRIYGDKMDTLWGETIAIPEEQVVSVEDGQLIQAAGLTFEAIDTPGHAWHHHVYQLGDIAFTGDAAGVRLPGTPFVDLPAPPPEFKREVWLETVAKLRTLNLSAIYPTHFGRVVEVSAQLDALDALLKDASQFVLAGLEAGKSRDELVAAYEAWNRERARAAGLSETAVLQYETANPWYMSVDGIMRYWQRKHR